MKTTKKDFLIFKKWFLHYQKFYGLTDWDVYFEHGVLKDAYATITSDCMARKATVRFATAWPMRERTEMEFRRCALHECNHLLIARLRWIGTCRYVGEEEIHEEDEALVIRLTAIIAELEKLPKIDDSTSGRGAVVPQKRHKKK